MTEKKTLWGDPQLVALLVVMALAVGMVYLFGVQLAPFILAFLIAYFLDGGVVLVTQRGVPRGVGVAAIFGIYLLVWVGLLVGPLQLMVRRAVDVARHLGENTDQLLQHIQGLPDPSFGLLPENMRADFLNYVLGLMQRWLNFLLSGSLEMVGQVTTWVIYLFLVPLLVFFFLKDKEALIRGLLRCLPRRRELVDRIWLEMEERMGNYVRGKIWEILIVGLATWLVFALLGFEFPVVYGVLSGVSVLIPYVGAIGLGVAVVIQGVLQWGLGWEVLWLMVAYTVIQVVDGNVLVPLIFSEALKLHPVVILIAVVLFGSLWGFWGVVFAIPLATLVKALLTTVAEHREREEETGSPPSAAT